MPFDPVGFLVSKTIGDEVFLQEMCTAVLDWDDALHEELKGLDVV